MCFQYCAIPRKGGLLMGVVRKIDMCLCGFLPRTQCFSPGSPGRGQSKAPAQLFIPLCKQRCSLAFVCLKPGAINTSSISVPTCFSLQCLAEMDMGITGCLNPYMWPRRSRVFFVSSNSDEFGSYPKCILFFSMKCIVRVLTSPAPSSVCKTFQVSSDYSMGLISNMSFVDKLRLVNIQISNH